jgi:DNA-binding LacI/PurR family transcriptional regulator
MVDVANRANVALATVSYALSGRRPVAAATRRRIMRAVEELGYAPNSLARGLASKRSNIVTLLLRNPERGIGFTEMEFVTGATQAAEALGYQLLLSLNDMSSLRQAEALAGSRLVDGAVIMEVHLDDERVSILEEAGIPFSMIGRPRDSAGRNCADIDFDRTAHDAVQHLYELGHQSIAFLNHSPSTLSSAYGPTVRAEQGFRAAAAEFGVRYKERLCGDGPDSGLLEFRDLLREAPDLTAVAVMNDRAAAGVLRAITEIGAGVPEDYSIIAVASSARVTEMFQPRLTTLEPPAAELGGLAVRLLIESLQAPPDDPREPVQALLPCRLVLGASLGPARVA